MKNICGNCHKEYDLTKVRVHEAHPFNFCKCPHCGATNIVKPIEGAPEESENKPSRIYEYPCGIYPRMIWVAFDCPKEVLDDLFEDQVRHYHEEEAVNAFTMHNRRMKPEVRGGMLMVFKKEALTPDIVAHEAVHAAMGICQYCGMEVSCDDDMQEYFAYLVGWIVECVYKALDEDGKRV